MMKGTKPVVIPVEHHRLRRVLKVGDMNLDGMLLADTVQAADTLFQQVRVERQVEQHQVMGKLEIATLTANL